MRKVLSHQTIKILQMALYWVPAQSALAEWTIGASGEAPGFLRDTKITESLKYAGWLINAGAGGGAVTFIILSGNYMRQGQYGRALGAGLGGIMCASAPWLTSLAQG